MEYKLIGQNNYLFNPLETILQNRGIVNIDEFLNVNASHTHHYSLLANIDNAVELLLTHINRNNIIFMQVDSDCDGMTSAALMYNYIKLIAPDIQIMWRVHTGKEHGVIPDTVPDGVGLVIIPDAGSNQFNEHKILHERGIDVIVLDHHQVNGNNNVNEYAIIVNNQMCDYPNKSLSGVGIVYKFCKALDDKLGVNYADRFLDLVALGNIADVMDMRSLETRYYALKGLEQINNPFFKALLKKQEFSTKGIVNITNVAFYIAPLINACIRVGDTKEKEAMFKSFIGSQELVLYKKRGISKEELVPIVEDTTRVCANAKSRQDRLRDKGAELLEQKIEEENLLQDKILIVDATNILESTLTGLVATQLANKYCRPIILLRHNSEDNTFSGSGRGYERCVIKDFRKLLENTKLFSFVEGHSNAFGVAITENNLQKLKKLLNEQLKDVEFVNTYEVDFVIPSTNINKNFVFEIARNNNIWSQGVDEPLIAFTEIAINGTDIQFLGKTRNTIKFVYKDVEFVKFFCSEEEIASIENLGRGSIEFEIVGRCSINEYNGNTTPQVIITDYNVKKSRKFTF